MKTNLIFKIKEFLEKMVLKKKVRNPNFSFSKICFIKMTIMNSLTVLSSKFLDTTFSRRRDTLSLFRPLKIGSGRDILCSPCT